MTENIPPPFPGYQPINKDYKQDTLPVRTHLGIGSIIWFTRALALYYFLEGAMSSYVFSLLAKGERPNTNGSQYSLPFSVEAAGDFFHTIVTFYLAYMLLKGLWHLQKGKKEINTRHTRSVGTCTGLFLLAGILMMVWAVAMIPTSAILMPEALSEEQRSVLEESGLIYKDPSPEQVYRIILSTSSLSSVILFGVVMALFFATKEFLSADERRWFFFGTMTVIMGSSVTVAILTFYHSTIISGTPQEAIVWSNGAKVGSFIISLGFFLLLSPIGKGLIRLKKDYYRPQKEKDTAAKEDSLPAEADESQKYPHQGDIEDTTVKDSLIILSRKVREDYTPPGNEGPSFSEVFKGDADMLYQRGKEEMKEGNYGSAYRFFIKAREAGMDDPKVLKAAGTAAYKKGDVKKAYEHFKEYLSLNPEDKEVNLLKERIEKTDEKN